MRNIMIIVICLAAIIAGFIYHPLVGVGIIVLLLALSFYVGRGNVYLMLSKMEAGKGNADKGRQWLEKAYNTVPNNTNIAITYSYELLREDETERAAQILSDISAAHLAKENEISYKLNQSIVLWRQGKQQESIALAEELYEKYKNTVVYGTLGYYYILNDQLQEALKINEEAYEFNDTNNAILDNLGLTYYYLGRYEEAKPIFEQLMQGEPTFREAYYNMGLLYESEGDLKAAYGCYKQACEYRAALVSHVTLAEIEAKLASLETQLEQLTEK